MTKKPSMLDSYSSMLNLSSFDHPNIQNEYLLNTCNVSGSVSDKNKARQNKEQNTDPALINDTHVKEKETNFR